MTCAHLEETSAMFDREADRGAHADACSECRAFLRDAGRLRGALRTLTFEEPRRRALVPVLVPAALLLAVVLLFILRPAREDASSPFAGLDGGGRATITVREAR